MLLVDVLVRYPTVAILLVLALLACRDARSNQTAIYAALTCITAAALLLGTALPELVLPRPIHVFVRFLDMPSVVFVWWFGRSLFEDDFRIGVLEIAGLLIVVGPVTLFRFMELGYIDHVSIFYNYFVGAVSVLMMLHLIFVAVSGRHDDVIEERRKVRFYFVFAMILVTILIILSERVIGPQHGQYLSLFRAVTTLPLALWGLFWLTNFHSEKLSFESVRPAEPLQTKIDPRDQNLHVALVNSMVDQQIYTEQGLTIRGLAEHLKTPEHRLRALINQGLGYRNFSSFLNYYRINAVKEAMQEPENSRIPVLTLAMNVGFNSLAPFNRAFLSINGQTPTEYRAELHGNVD